MEPEHHIQIFGIDHYLITIFPNDTLQQRNQRRHHLLSYECFKQCQELYERNKFIYIFKY